MNEYCISGNIFRVLILASLFFYANVSAQAWSKEYLAKAKQKLSAESGLQGSSIPNDPLLFPNNIIPYHQYHLNIQANGFSIDYPATWQYARGHALLGMLDTSIYALHPDLTGNYRNHLSNPLIFTEEPSAGQEGVFEDHGSWVLGVLAPTNNNNEGLTGVCQNCSVVADFFGASALRSISTGVQAINMSFGGSTDTGNCTSFPDLCSQFENEMVERDIVLVAISQNRHTWINIPLYGDTFPGNHPNVIQVGGLDQSLQFWNDCDENFVGTGACGSLATKYQELVAPSKNILTAITYTVNGNGNCGEVNNPPHSAYDICSGNSFSAPQVTGLIGIIRSVYPQLSAPNVRLLLQKTAQSPHAERHDEWGYGLINPLAAVTDVLGTAAGVQLTNRSIPFFVVRSNLTSDTAFSSSPQFIAAALSEDFRGFVLGYQPLNVGLALNSYKIPSSDLLPYAAFHILGTHNNPLSPGKELVKLYRLSRLESTGADLALDHAYVTAPYIEQFKTEGYVVDVIEGYIFPPCDAADNSCQPPAHSECIFARNTATAKSDWAIMLESQLADNAFQGHTVKLNNATDDICLGYAYQPIDSDTDGLIDGYEVFLGTNINLADSDSDGRSDGEEMLVPIEAMFSDPLSNANSFAMNPGLTGTWAYSEATSQGLLFDVMEPVAGEDGNMFGAWFTYDLLPGTNNAAFGSSENRWFTVFGNYAGDKADLDIYLQEGGRFDKAKAITDTIVGKMVVRFTSCTDGVVSYLFDQTSISGSFPITRLSPDQFCQNGSSALSKATSKPLNNILPKGGLTGAWANPQAPESGQGILFDVMEESGKVFAAWFTYSLDGNSPSVDFGSADHRWFIAYGDWSGDGSEMTIALTEGGVFDKPTVVVDKEVGSLQVNFDSCTSGSVEYQFPDLGISGSFPIQRLSPNVFCLE
ncbi:MAG: S8/S53 family peptidase [Xanthomonadales bacterium]|nr:S8/S53 family peptidase [Xanthomonadales bacterium]